VRCIDCWRRPAWNLRNRAEVSGKFIDKDGEAVPPRRIPGGPDKPAMEVQPIAIAVSALENVYLGRLQDISAKLADPLPTQGPTPAAMPPASDVSAALLSEMAAPDIERLTAILEPRRSLEVSAHITELTHDTTLALAEGDSTRALANLTEIAAADPHSVAVLAPDKVLQPIRPEVDQLLNRLTTVAKMDAEGRLAQADDALETPGHTSVPNWQTKPETLLQVAHRLFESGGYTNYVRSADVAQVVLNTFSPLAYSPFVDQRAVTFASKPASAATRLDEDELLPKRPMLSAVKQTWTAVRATATPRLQTLWLRAPLLVLLLGWLILGLVAGPALILLRSLWPESWPASLVDFGFEVWGIGFLALVCFGFYARIRDIRS